MLSLVVFTFTFAFEFFELPILRLVPELSRSLSFAINTIKIFFPNFQKPLVILSSNSTVIHAFKLVQIFLVFIFFPFLLHQVRVQQAHTRIILNTLLMCS